jgi:hypothetical protein
MFHVTTSFNICNSLNPVPNAWVHIYLTIHITKLVNNKKEKGTLSVLLGKGLKKKCLNRTPKQICLKIKIKNYITSISKIQKNIYILLIFMAT